MKTVDEWLTDMESESRACAPARGHSILVSGRVRVECEYLPKVDRLTWRVDDHVVTRELAGKALEHARKYKYAPFTAHKPSKG